MHSMLFLGGWAEYAPPRVAWTGADPAGRALTLTALPTALEDRAPAVATNEERTIRCVVAGSLYNRRELAVALGGRHAFSGRDDAELVVHLYEERGFQCVKALRGPFALALWDNRVGRLVIARDQLGLVPVYYANDGGRLAVSSALRTLVKLPGLADGWDPAALEAFLTFGFVPPPATVYPSIRQLAPGELGIWESGRLKLQQYWQLTFPERRLSPLEAPGVVREQALDALRLRHVGATPGLLLSGGLASGALLALASADRRPPARAYTGLVAGSGDAERARAAKLAARFGVEHAVAEEVPDWPAVLDGLLETYGEPAAGLDAAVLALAGSRAALDGGVALAGVGAHAVFGGALPAQRAARVTSYNALPGFAREVLEMWSRLGPAGRTAELRAAIDGARLAPLELYARAVSSLWPEERADLFTPETIASIGDTAPWRLLATRFAAANEAGAADTADAMHHVELSFRLPAIAAVAEVLAVRGVELRLPFADHKLAHVLASVGSTSRGGPRDRQHWLAAAVANQLPRGVLRAPHRPAAPPATAWTSGGLRAFAEETFTPARIGAQGIFQPDAVARLWREHLARERDHGTRLWSIALATRWLERRPKAAPAVPAPRPARDRVSSAG